METIDTFCEACCAGDLDLATRLYNPEFDVTIDDCKIFVICAKKGYFELLKFILSKLKEGLLLVTTKLDISL